MRAAKTSEDRKWLASRPAPPSLAPDGDESPSSSVSAHGATDLRPGRSLDGALIPRLLEKSSSGAVHEASGAGDRACVSRCLQDLERLLGPSIWVETEADPDLPSVRCDPFELLTALLNLATNGRDALPGSGCVRIRVRALATGTVEISVADDGVGMSPATVQRAVDPYFTTKTCGLGGAGLPMVDGFVRQVGGEMIIKSELGVGTAVTLQLPVFDEA